MLIIGCDYHPSVQQIAWVDTETGECGERRLTHSGGEAEQFYRELKKKGISVRVGMEATGHSRWFERLLAELNSELWVGDPAQIRAKRVRKQKNDRRDAEHLLKLMLENNFPRIWVPTPENRDVRQLVLHRHRMVGMPTRVMNQLQAIAMNEGVWRKRGLWTEKGRAQLESSETVQVTHGRPLGSSVRLFRVFHCFSQFLKDFPSLSMITPCATSPVNWYPFRAMAPMGGVRDSGWGRTGPRSLDDFSDVIWINSQSGQRQYPF